jgi:hypothetical protein
MESKALSSPTRIEVLRFLSVVFTFHGLFSLIDTQFAFSMVYFATLIFLIGLFGLILWISEY